MTLAPLVNIQKTSRRQNAQGYGALSRMEHLVKGSENVKIKSGEGASHQP